MELSPHNEHNSSVRLAIRQPGFWWVVAGGGREGTWSYNLCTYSSLPQPTHQRARNPGQQLDSVFLTSFVFAELSPMICIEASETLFQNFFRSPCLPVQDYRSWAITPRKQSLSRTGQQLDHSCYSQINKQCWQFFYFSI